MRLILGGETVAIFRDEAYIKEFKGFAAAKNQHVVSTAEEMELALLLSRGYPAGSYQAYSSLIKVAAAEWAEGLAYQEFKGPGNAQKALRQLHFQRIYEKNGVAIVYMLKNTDTTTTILLGALSICNGEIPDILWKMLHIRP